MTSATKNVWLVVIENEDRLYSETTTFKYAAYDLPDLLSFFNENGKKRILKAENLDETITYKY